MPVAPPARPRPRAALAALVALGAVLLLAPPGAVLAAERTVHIADGTLSPKSLAIAPGTTVTWVNDEGNRHRVRSTSGPGEFDSGDLDPGERFSFTFTAEGSYAYRDERAKDDPAYQGTITVSSAPTPAPTPPGATPPPGSTPAPPPAAPTVHMAGRAFRPATLTIDAGQSVVFLNDDSRDHTATARDRSFDTGTLAPGQRASRTFRTPGTFAYYCVIHPDMVGTIAVRGPGGATPPPPPPPTPTPKPTPVPPPPAGGVAVIDYGYRPASLTVTAGATVTWVNQGAAPHTVTATDGSFDSGIFEAGGRYRRTFTVAGTYRYFCELHPQMQATLLVAPAGGGAVPTPRPTPRATPRPPAPPEAPTTLDAGDLFFRPETISIPTGTTLTWRNVGVAPHTVTANDRSFDSGIFAAGASWSRRFATPGTFPYFCAVHPQMTGTVIVTLAAAGGGGSAASASATPGASASPPPSPGEPLSPPPSGTPGAVAGGGTAGGPGGGGGPGPVLLLPDGGAAPAAPAPAPAPAVDPGRLALVALLVVGAMGAFAAVIRGLVPGR